VLQNTFNEKVFQNELRLFQEENIKTNLTIEECPSNHACVGLIYARSGPSIVGTLHATAELANSSDEIFCENLHKVFGGSQLDSDAMRFFSVVHPKDRKTLFTVRHFAGEVTYSVGEKGNHLWLNKNHDKIPDDMPAVLSASSNALVASLSGAAPATRKGSVVAAGVGAFARKASVSDRFITSMSELCETLSISQCSFIRCIKPNAAAKPNEFDKDFVVNQIRALGLVQVCEVMKVGLPTRISFAELRDTPSLAVVMTEAKKLFAGEPDEVLITAVLWALGVPDESYEMGITRVFFRAGQLNALERILTTNFSSDINAIKGRLADAHRVRVGAKGIVDNLHDQLKGLDDGFASNRAQIAALEDLLQAVLDTDVWEGGSRSEVSNVSNVLSLAQASIHDVEVNAKDLAAKGADVYDPVSSIIENAKGHLNNAEVWWHEIDEKCGIVDAFVVANAVEEASSLTSQATNDLEFAASLMSDVKHMVSKTIMEANRCQLTRFERRADDCKHNITVMKERLAANSADLHRAVEEVRRVQSEQRNVHDVVAAVQALCARAFGIGPVINGLCDDARAESTNVRLKLVTDLEERKRLEAEAREREAVERTEREVREREAAMQEVQLLCVDCCV
jgi:myosin heavy subunit